jgi:hypothetical protein
MTEAHPCLIKALIAEMIVNLGFVFIGLLNFVSTIKSKKTPPTTASPSPPPSSAHQPQTKTQAQAQTKTTTRQVTPIAQMDFLVTPDDFKHDEDVAYILNQLHRPQTVEKFYLSAAQLYDDLAVAYREIQADANVAKQFLNIMKRLTTASLKEPLTVTNLIFAASKHLRPLFSHKSLPIEDIYLNISDLERDRSRKLIWIMTQFFLSFTLREVNQIQDFIRLVSLATLSSEQQPQPQTPVAPKPVNKSTGKTTVVKAKTGELDISRTSLESYSERIRITISNALAKMIILLDLFVTDPTVVNRSIKLVNHLWSLHLRRLAKRENVPFEELDDKWKDPILYRKSAIHFTFQDWDPDSFSAETMAELRRAAESEEFMDNAVLAQQASSRFFYRAFWITTTMILLLSTCTAVYFYLKRRQRLQEQQQQQLDLTSFESQSINEIVSKLESNVE